MSDQKKWFKVWASIIHDANFENIRLEDIGAWTLLGALMCEQGSNGKLVIIPPATITLAMFRCPTIEQLKCCFKRLPNITLVNGAQTVQDHGANGQFQRLDTPPKNDNDAFTVIMNNWHKYQVDSSVYGRVKRLRYKKREEEKRGEQTPFLSEKQDPKWM